MTERPDVIAIVKDYLAVNEGKMSKMFFCKKYKVSPVAFEKLAYKLDEDLCAENERLRKELEMKK